MTIGDHMTVTYDEPVRVCLFALPLLLGFASPACKTPLIRLLFLRALAVKYDWAFVVIELAVSCGDKKGTLHWQM